MKKLILIIAALTLAGCPKDPPNVRIETVEVVREVPKPCPGVRPPRPALIPILPGDLAQLAAVLGAKLAEYSAPGNYADQADAIFDRCPLAASVTPEPPSE
jgi:hypothetical protein